MAAQTTNTAWPADVIPRYLTVGGSSLGRDDIAVDITCTRTVRGKGRYDQEVGDITLIARCSGCYECDEATYEGLYLDHVEPAQKSFCGDRSRTWAQSHAEKCRAMPTPTT